MAENTGVRFDKIGLALAGALVSLIIVVALVGDCRQTGPGGPANEVVSASPPPVSERRQVQRVPATTSRPAPVPVAPKVPKWTVYKLHEAFRATYNRNPVAAEEAFRDKRVQVDGFVRSIGLTETFLGDRAPVVTLLDGDRLLHGQSSRDIRCGLRSSEANSVAQIRKGQRVVIEGRIGIDSTTGGLHLYDCSLRCAYWEYIGRANPWD